MWMWCACLLVSFHFGLVWLVVSCCFFVFKVEGCSFSIAFVWLSTSDDKPNAWNPGCLSFISQLGTDLLCQSPLYRTPSTCSCVPKKRKGAFWKVEPSKHLMFHIFVQKATEVKPGKAHPPENSQEPRSKDHLCVCVCAMWRPKGA